MSEHVKAGEEYLAAAHRGLKEELGLENMDLEPIITFKMNYGRHDNELCRLFQGLLADPSQLRFDPVEVESVGYASLEELQQLLADRKKPFSRWFEQMLLWSAKKPTDLRILTIHGPLRPDTHSA